LVTISADIVRIATGTEAFELTVMVFVWIPSLPVVLKTTSREPLAPGARGFVLYSGTVHPHVVVAE
jgi:hypothetical protein